jgi:hypothetical protein
MKKAIVLVIFLITLSVVWIILSHRSPSNNPTPQGQAAAMAIQLYQQKKAQGTDFSRGPCLSNNLMPDWVADIAHNPRQLVDNMPENQCPAYREGQAHHFVELDPDGNIIKAL